MRFGRVLTTLLLAVPATGCITGHLLDAGRLQERVVHYEAAYSDGSQLHLRYEAVIEDAGGRAIERVQRGASLALAELRARPALPVDELRVARAPADAPCPRSCRPLAFVPVRRAELADALAAGSPGPVQLVLRFEDGETLRVPGGALADQHTAVWVFALLPLTVAADAAGTVPLVVLAIPYLFFD